MSQTLDERLEELKLSNISTMSTGAEILGYKAALEEHNLAFLQLAEEYKQKADDITQKSLELVTFSETLIEWIKTHNAESDVMSDTIASLKEVFTS